MMMLRLLEFLFALLIPVFPSLPWSTDILESKGPGTVLQTFLFNCSSYMPTLELLSVKPPTSFFNKPSLQGQKGLYRGKVTLSSSALLDALAVNYYELQLRYTCGNFVVDGSFFVHVLRDPGRIHCTGAFASPGEARGTGLGEEGHVLQQSLPDLISGQLGNSFMCQRQSHLGPCCTLCCCLA